MPGEHRHFVITWNNYTDASEAHLEALREPIVYLAYSHEVAPTTGTPHLQGFCHVNTPMTKFQLRKLLRVSPTNCPWAEEQFGTNQQNLSYITKDSNPTAYVYGSPLPDPPKKISVEDLPCIIDSGMTLATFIRTYPKLYVRNKALVHALISTRRSLPEMPPMVLFPWQAEILDLLEQPPSPREIHFYIESEGSVGKSEIVNYILAKYETSMCTIPMKLSDLANMIPETTTIFMLDVPRDWGKEIHLPYSFLEALKDRRISSGKYEGSCKGFRYMHVLVFSNFEPEFPSLSKDRFKLHYL